MRPIDADALIEFCAERWIPLNIDAVNMQPTIQPEKAQLSPQGTTSDLISRQEAIDALDFEIVHMTAYCDGKNEGNPFAQYNKGLEDGKKAIEALPPAQPEPQWIQVSERLPEESEYYIITANDGVGHRTTFAKFQKKAKSWDLTGARSYWRVIAWMPLPEPYKPNNE